VPDVTEEVTTFRGDPRRYHFDPRSVRDADLELHVQAGILQRLMIGFPECKVAAVPNGTNITTRAGRGKAKAEGLATGFPDLVIMAPEAPRFMRAGLGPITEGRRALTAFVEVKAKEDTSPAQHEWLNWMADSGFLCGVFRSHETVAQKLKEWGFPHREREVRPPRVPLYKVIGPES
jgi:hypothetical protein